MGADTGAVAGCPRQRNRLRWGLSEFLRVPLLVVLGSLVLAGLACAADRSGAAWLVAVRAAVGRVVPSVASSAMMQTVTPGLITAISIIFFVTLMAVQQHAGTFTTGVLDQFIQRRLNQVFFGFYVGLGTYTVVVLALVPASEMVISAAVASLLGVIGMAVLLLFIYNIFDQLRPSSSAGLIARLALLARAAEQDQLSRCRSRVSLGDVGTTGVTTTTSGYVVGVDLDALARAAGGARSPVEVELRVSMGDRLVAGDTLARVHGVDHAEREQLARAVLGAVSIGRTRDIGRDAKFSVDQLAAMAWTASSSGQDPEGAAVAVESLHTLLAAWGGTDPTPGDPELPIVYNDTLVGELIGGLCAVIVASGQSGQHQTCSKVLNVLANVLPRLSAPCQRDVIDELGRTITAAAGHVLSVGLEQAHGRLRQALHASGAADLASRLDEIENEMQTQSEPAAALNALRRRGGNGTGGE